MPTFRIAGLIELLDVVDAGMGSDTTLLGTLREISGGALPSAPETSDANFDTVAEEQVFCDREALIVELEKEFWRIESELRVSIGH